MAGHTALPRGGVSLLGVIVGGLLMGAGGFGLFRVTNANPSGELPGLPALPPVSEGRPDPVGLQPVIPAAAPVPIVALPPLKDLPKTGELVLPPVLPTLPTSDPTPVPALPKLTPVPKVGELPLPGGFEPLALPALPSVTPAPKPVPPSAQPVELAPLPSAVPVVPSIPSANPDFNLRPASPANTVNPKPTPVEVPPAPRPAVSVVPEPLGQFNLQTTPGDPPVPLTLRQTMMSAAIGLGFALAPTPVLRAQDPPKEKDPKPAVEVDVKKQIEDLKKEVAALRTQNEVQADFIMGRKDGTIITQVDKGLLKRVQTLEEAIARIEKKLDTAKQVAGSSPIGGGNPAPVSGNGTLRLINEYATDVKIVVNGTSYDMKPSEQRELSVPSGEFVYELMSAGAMKTTSTIKVAERVTLRIR